MARGGRRQGTPGTNYPKRVDLTQPIKAISGQEYGQRAAIEQAQRNIPLPNNAAGPPPLGNAPASSSPPGVAGGGGPPVSALPGQMDFARPTERPMEPVTAGTQGGDNQPPLNDPVMAQLLALYHASGADPQIQRLIELRSNGYGR